MRYLIKIAVLYDGKNNWTLQANRGLGIKTFHGTPEQFTKLLRRLKASDSSEDPRSYRTIPYGEMCRKIMNGLDRYVYVWSYMWPFGANKSVGVIPNGQKQESKVKVIQEYDVSKDIEKNVKKDTEEFLQKIETYYVRDLEAAGRGFGKAINVAKKYYFSFPEKFMKGLKSTLR